MNILDMTTIRLAAGLILVILANIALGVHECNHRGGLG